MKESAVAASMHSLALLGFKQASVYEVGHGLNRSDNKARFS